MKALFIRKSAAALGVAMALLTSSSCYAKRPPRPPAIAARAPKISTIVGEWKHGFCELSKTKLTCANGTEKKSIELDVIRLDKKVAKALESSTKGMLVSDDYTVILSSEYVVVSLGPESLFSGKESFGLALRFVNSYSINLDKVSKEGMKKAELTGASLKISTDAGKNWSIDLSNPHGGWYIY